MTVNTKYTVFKILWIALLLSVICDFYFKNYPKPSTVGVIYVIVLPVLIPWKTIIQPFTQTNERTMTLILVSLLASMYLSSLFSENRALALDSTIFRFTLFYSCLLSTLVYTNYFNKSINFIIKSLIAVNLLIATSSILDFYIPPFNRLLIDYFGHWDIKHSNLKLDGVEYMRPSGLITDTNLTAFSIVVSCLLCLLNENKMGVGWFKYIFYAISGCSFGMLASRSALIALIFSVAVFFFAKKIERKRIYVFLLVFFLVQLSTPQTLSRIKQIFESTYVEEDITVGRIILWKAAFRAFESSPLTGIGTGVFFVESINYLREVWDESSHGDFWSYERYRLNPHNIFLSMLAEEGLIGFTIFVLLIIYYLRLLVQQKKYIALTVMIALLIVSSLSNYAPYYKYYMVLCIALYICAKQDMKIINDEVQ